MAQNKLTNLLVTAWRRLGSATDHLRQRRASINEIGRLDAQEMTCLAQDLGIPADETRTLATKDKHAADLLARRMETLGLDPARLNSTVMHDLQRCCSMCTEKGLCIHELEDKPRDPTWPKYCPNEQTLVALKEGQITQRSDV